MTNTETHYHQLAEGVDQMRETLRAMVAGLVADGYTEDQSRQITVAVITAPRNQEDE